MTGNETRRSAWSQFLGVHAIVQRAIERRLKAAGQPPLAWYDLLLELERGGGEMRIGDLAARLVIEPYNMTRLLDRLVREGLVERKSDPRDRRALLVSITPAGQMTRQEMWPHYRSAIDAEFSDALTEEDASALTAILGKLKSRPR